MNPNAKDVFLDAIDLPPDQRQTFVEKACAGDATLLAAVRKLLEAHDAAAGVFHRETATLGVSEETTRTRTAPLNIGDIIGRYTLKQLLGEGGFGSVFLAEQFEPVVRDVAIKVLRVHAHINEIVDRFEAERQVLAIMEHPGIARVYDAGTTDDGRPFIAMEYVDGLPITDYANSHSLSLQQRLSLFADVCSAVQHAHQKGIIHRDLKPTNILVTTIDGAPVPKVIDFGIAKAIDPEQPVSPVLTQAFQIIGTPQYMAPEQTVAGAKDVDTRADVYSLGTVLYELVAGVPPFDIDRLKRAGLEEICRLIREETPVKPSTRLSNIADASQSGSANTRTIARTLGGSLDREVDWIVMRALEKDRTRRYQSPADLAADIDRHLRHEAILAGPPSRIYQIQKFVRRNRVAVAAAAVVAVALVAATVVSSIMYVREVRAERRAVANELEARRESKRATEAEQLAVANEREARRELQRATAIADFTRNLLAGIKPSVARGRDPELMRDLLVRALDTSEERLGQTPDLNLVIRTIISEALYDLGEYEVALRSVKDAYDKAKDAPREDRWRGGIAIANAFTDLQQNEPARSMLDAITKEVVEAGMSDSAIGLELRYAQVALANNDERFDEAEQGARAIIAELEKQKQGSSRLAMRALNAIGISQLQRGLNEAAAETWIEAIPKMKQVLGADDPLVINTTGNLAAVLMDLKRNDESARYHRDALEQMRKLYKADHPIKLTMLANFAYFLTSQKQYDEAAALLQEAEANCGKIDPFDPIALGIQSQSISTDDARGRWDLVIARAEKLMKMFRGKFGEKSPRVVGTYMHYLRGLVKAGRADEALNFIRSLGDSPVPDETPGRAAQSFYAACGLVYVQLGRIDEARAALTEAITAMNADLGVDKKPFRVRATTELEEALAAIERGDKVDLTAPATQPAK